MLTSDQQKQQLLSPDWKPSSELLSSDRTENSQCSESSPAEVLEAASNRICPAVWMAPRRRKVGGRLSMMDLPIPSWNGADDVPFPDPSKLLPNLPIPQFPLQIRTEELSTSQGQPVPRVKSPRESHYQPLTDEEEDHALDLNSKLKSTLRRLEKEIPSFSLREAICKKPTVPMRPPKKSKLMERRSLGF